MKKKRWAIAKNTRTYEDGEKDIEYVAVINCGFPFGYVKASSYLVWGSKKEAEEWLADVERKDKSTVKMEML